MTQSLEVRKPMPPVAVVVSFIDGINRGDVDRLAELMADDHRLNEALVEGKESNIDGWMRYISAFPECVIYPHRVVARDAEVVVLGHTTGSHLDLPDEQESTLTLLWRAIVNDGRLCLWQLITDTPERRTEFGIALES